MLQHTSFCVTVYFVGEILKRRIKQSADFKSPIGEAFVNLLVAADYAQTQIDRVCAEFDITRGQYNVLGILRGAGKDGHPRYEIAARMVEKAPDVTRLIDRLEKQGLVVRERSDEDKRHSITRISQKGLKLLDKVEPKIDELKQSMSKKLSLPEWIALSSLCEKLYDEQN